MTTKEGDFVNTHTQAASQMTEGPIWKRILFFALPLMVGNLFQQLYNTVDNIVVGNLGGKEALAVVGTVDPVINTFIGFFLGMSAEAGVVIFQYYGAKDEKKVSRILSGVRHFVTHQKKDYSFIYRYGGDFF